MNVLKAYNQLLNEDYDKEIDKIEKILKGKIAKENDIIIQQELYFLLLNTLLKKNKIETSEMNILFYKFMVLTDLVEKELNNRRENDKDFSSKMLLDVFYKTNIYKISQLRKNYQHLGFDLKANELHVLEKELEKRNSLTEKNYKQYFSLQMQKIFSKYGTSFRYLSTVTILITMLFGLIFQISDHITKMPYICGKTCIHKCNIEEGQNYGLDQYGNTCTEDIKTLRNYDYYFYVSIATISNLGGDMAQAGNSFIIAMLGIEQIVGVVLFGILIMLLANRL